MLNKLLVTYVYLILIIKYWKNGYASTLKKRTYQVTEDEISKEFKFLKNIVPLSSGDAILETIKLHS